MSNESAGADALTRSSPAEVSETLALVAPGRPMLDYLPVGLFGSVMGVTGLSVAWRLAHVRYGAPEEIALAIAAVALVTFVLTVAGYSIKLATAFRAVRQEFRHPIAGNLFGTVLISILQPPIVLAPLALPVAQIMWIVGAAGMFFFAWLIVPLDDRPAAGCSCHARLDHSRRRIAACRNDRRRATGARAIETIAVRKWS